MLKTHVRSSPDWVQELKDSWIRLADAAPSATMFQTWEWQSTWWGLYHGSKRPHILEIREGDDMVGLMPFTVTSGLWRVLMPMGYGKSDYLHPVARAGFEAPVGELVAEYVEAGRHFDYVHLQALRETEPIVAGLDPVKLVPEVECYVLELPESFEAYLETLHRNLRRDLRHCEARESAWADIEIRYLGREDAESGMEALFDLHGRRWRERGVPGAFAFEKVRRLHRDFAVLAADRGWLRLTALFTEGAAISMLKAVELHGTCFVHLNGFDPAHKALAPGAMVYGFLIKRALEEGCRRIDFMTGATEFKRQWRPQHTYRNMGWKSSRPGVRGVAAQKWYESVLPRAIELRRSVKMRLSRSR